MFRKHTQEWTPLNVNDLVRDVLALTQGEFESHGVRIFVDPKSLAYLEGTELDFVRDGLNEGFKFNNPKEKDRCGCGESFRV